MTYIECELNIPPSVNTAYSGKTIRYKSKQYKEWLKNTGFKFLNDNDQIEWDNWLKVTYTFYFSLYTKNKDKRIRDVFNYEKLTSDYLSTIISWFSDHKIKLWIVEKVDSESEKVKVRIEEI